MTQTEKIMLLRTISNAERKNAPPITCKSNRDKSTSTSMLVQTIKTTLKSFIKLEGHNKISSNNQTIVWF